MREHPCRTRLDATKAAVVLPAEGATLATSLGWRLLLVAHTGKAHLGIPVDRALLRDLARAQSAATARSRALATNDDASVARVDMPEVIPFRHATSHTVLVSGGEVHLTLLATGDRNKPDAQVELRMNGPLLEHLAQHQNQRRGKDRMLALAWLLILTSALLATLAFVA